MSRLCPSVTSLFLMLSLSLLGACVGDPIIGRGVDTEPSVDGPDGPDGGESITEPMPNCEAPACSAQVNQVSVSGFDYEETELLRNLLISLPTPLTAITAAVTRDHLDQSSCPDPRTMSIEELNQEPYVERCGFSWFKINLETGATTIRLMNQLMINNPDRVQGDLVRNLAQALYFANEEQAVAVYADSFGGLERSECFACPANGEPCAAVGSGLRDRVAMAVDFATSVAAISVGPTVFGDAGLQWRRGTASCSPASRETWFQQDLAQGRLGSKYVLQFDVYASCGADDRISVQLDAPVDTSWAILANNMNAYLGSSPATTDRHNFNASGGIHKLSMWSASPIAGTLSCD